MEITMPDKIRFAIVGLDHWYTAIDLAERLAKHPDVELVGIADRNGDHLQQVAEKAGVTRTSMDLNEFVDDPEIDAIGSFVTVDQNPQVVIRAAQAGKHIVSVKPLARTLAEATRIVEAVRRSGVMFIPAETRSRESAQNQRLYSLVRSGKLGKVVSGNFVLRGSLPVRWPCEAADGGWWADPERGPGGGWIDHSIYQIDLLRWVLGERVVAVTGRAANLVHKDLGVEDYGHAIIEFEGGAIFSLEDTWSGPIGGWGVSSSLIGTEGVVTIDSVSGNFSEYTARGDAKGWHHEKLAADSSDPIAPIVKHLRGEQTVLGSVEDAWENLAVARAFYDSAARGTVVTPEHLDAAAS
jgi:predicted dehydrogenase